MYHPNVIVLWNEISREFPSFRIRPKTSSILMRVINAFLWLTSFGRTSFMTDFTTTLGTTVYVPTGWDARTPTHQCVVLRHERVHMRQAKKYGFLVFAFLYLFVPVPFFRASYRTRFEKEAYEESLRAGLEYGQDLTGDMYRAGMVGHFTSSEYLFMWTKKEDIEGWFDAALKRTTLEKKN